MSIQEISMVSEQGKQIVPELSDYSAHSAVWEECEYQTEHSIPGTVLGFWKGEPGWIEFTSWPYHEVCVIVSGSVALVDDSGDERRFGSGEAFVVPQGFRGRWVTLEPTTKYFVGISSRESA